MQEVLRLKKTVTDLLQKYSNEPNSAIVRMSIRIQELENDLKKEKAVTESLQNAFQSVTKPLQNTIPVTKSLRSEFKTETLPPQMNKTKYKDKLYDIKSDKNGDYIIDDRQMKRIVNEGKVIE
jgi:uncharacterized protein YaaN involved in tellurite resistance